MSAIPTTQIQRFRFTTRFYKLLAKKKTKKKEDAHNFSPGESALAFRLDAADVRRFLVVIEITWTLIWEKAMNKMLFFLLRE